MKKIPAGDSDLGGEISGAAGVENFPDFPSRSGAGRDACINFVKATVFTKLLRGFHPTSRRDITALEARRGAQATSRALQHALTRKLTVLTPPWPIFHPRGKKNDFNQPLALPWDEQSVCNRSNFIFITVHCSVNGCVPIKIYLPMTTIDSTYLSHLSLSLSVSVIMSLSPFVYRYIQVELLDKVNYRIGDMGNWKISTLCSGVATSSLVSSVSNLETRGEWTGSYRACLVSAMTNGDRFECDRIPNLLISKGGERRGDRNFVPFVRSRFKGRP